MDTTFFISLTDYSAVYLQKTIWRSPKSAIGLRSMTSVVRFKLTILSQKLMG